MDGHTPEPLPEASTPRKRRRRFLHWATVSSTGLFALTAVAGAVRLLWPSQPLTKARITVPADDVPIVGGVPYLSTAGGFYLTHTADGLLALSWRCTRGYDHCTVVTESVGAVRFACPCCGARFDLRGLWLSGPAPRPLDRFACAHGPDGAVIVNPNVSIIRDHYDPAQALPI
jgi:Rieske Fe-S protein